MDYIDGNSRFPPIFWAAPPDPEAMRTINGPGSFHAHLNEQFYACHPSIFVFVDVLLQLQTTSYIKTRTLSIKAAVRKNEKDKMDFVVEQYTKHTNGELSTVDFVWSVGYRYAARTDIFYVLLVFSAEIFKTRTLPVLLFYAFLTF